MKWEVVTTRLRKGGRLLGLARTDGSWSAQEFMDGMEWLRLGQARPRTLKAAQKACEKFLKQNAKPREEYLATRRKR